MCVRVLTVERGICGVCAIIPACVYIAVLRQNAVIYKGNRACVFNREGARDRLLVSPAGALVCVKLYAVVCTLVLYPGVYWIQW